MMARIFLLGELTAAALEWSWQKIFHNLNLKPGVHQEIFLRGGGEIGRAMGLEKYYKGTLFCV